MALEILKSSFGFLTTLPVKGDIEVLRRNLWVFPFVGIFIGAVISVPAVFGISFLCLLFYVAIEGVNHVDGLADFGDAFFAPEDRKKIALKDLNIGAGGVVFLCVYFLLLFYSFQRVEVLDIMISQLFAKFSMVFLLVTSKPAWQGMAKFMMEFAKKRDLVIGALPLLIAFLKPSTLISLFFVMLISILVKNYAEKKFGGVNGDVIGACNCISFATSLLVCSILNETNIFPFSAFL
ncbi:MAG: adenosylcobinamide-GDP ribazoletransferase [Archaeoglobaceae archaeon]